MSESMKCLDGVIDSSLGSAVQTWKQPDCRNHSQLKTQSSTCCQIPKLQTKRREEMCCLQTAAGFANSSTAQVRALQRPFYKDLPSALKLYESVWKWEKTGPWSSLCSLGTLAWKSVPQSPYMVLEILIIQLGAASSAQLSHSWGTVGMDESSGWKIQRSGSIWVFSIFLFSLAFISTTVKSSHTRWWLRPSLTSCFFP